MKYLSSARGQSVSLAMMLAAMAGAPAALAQERKEDEAASAATGRIEEIVVTAQRRQESLQDVPIAITALTSDNAQARGIKTTEDLTTAVAGLTFPKFTSQATPYIRGIGSNIISQGDENAVAIYIDGILQQTPNTALLSLDNIARIEVLKGPQGTLFGRNANGGVINITTLTPSVEPVVNATIGYGNYETVDASFYVSRGLADNLAADFAFSYHNQGKGFGHDIVRDDDLYKGRDLTLRSKLYFAPSEDTEITLSGGYNRFTSDDVCLRLAPGELALDGVTRTTDYYSYAGDAPCGITGRTYTASLSIEQSLGFAKLVSLTGYNNYRNNRPNDSDYSPAFILHAPVLDQIDKGWTQELQLQSNPGSPITWIVGGYYLNSKSGYPEPEGIALIGPAVGVDVFRILGVQKARSYAGFAQATVPITSQTNLTLGGRYTVDKRQIDGRSEILIGSDLLVVEEGHQSKNFKKWTYKITLDHQFSDNAMVYATHSTGFKAGLYNLTAPSTPPVEPETVKAYEIGFKSTLFDRRVRINGAAFHYDYRNIQAVAVAHGVSLPLFVNAAKARIRGFDVDLTATATDWLRIDAGLAYTDAKYTKFEGAQVSVSNAPLPGRTSVTRDVSGNRLIKTPRWSWNIAPQVTIPSAIGDLRLTTNVSYQSKTYWDFGNLLPEPARTLVSSSIAWESKGGLTVRVWGRNLFDKKYANTGLETAFGFIQLPAAPRTYGISLGVHLP